MSSPWLVALDVDGTIIDWSSADAGEDVAPREAISPAVRAAIAATVAAGHHVVIATGRSLVATTWLLAELDLREGFAVLSNGAVTVGLDPDVPERATAIEVITFDPTSAVTTLRRHLPDAIYAVEELGVGYAATGPFPAGELDGEFREVGFDELVTLPATRVIVRSTTHTPAEFHEIAQRAGLHDVAYSVGWVAWLDLAPYGVTKASGLEALRERLEVPREQTMAIGDGHNDIEMLAWAARGIAMGQADERTRAAANEVTAAVWDDGCALALRTLPGVE